MTERNDKQSSEEWIVGEDLPETPLWMHVVSFVVVGVIGAVVGFFFFMQLVNVGIGDIGTGHLDDPPLMLKSLFAICLLGGVIVAEVFLFGSLRLCRKK
ncbi:hypothetical protein JXA32_16720 [Candidatus Sumerlaeota bacterium]|nr:hypothetical protein [Candidatus Sumerlaeota bacterium]